jgi:hypothetical protein
MIRNSNDPAGGALIRAARKILLRMEKSSIEVDSRNRNKYLGTSIAARDAAQQSLAADGAIASLSSSLFRLSSDADRAPQLKAVVRLLSLS